MKIYLLRHGITIDKQIKKTYQNMPLSEQGKDQIINICPKINTNLYKIYTSPTIRTMESAKIVQSLQAPYCEIKVDLRLKNKIDNENDSYFENIIQLLNDLKADYSFDSDVLLVTHGRIIKMIYSIIKYNMINKEIMDNLNIDYADLFVFYLEQGNFLFPEFSKIE